MEEIITTTINIGLSLFWIVLIILLIVRVIKNKLAPFKTVKAEVLSKSVNEVFTRYGYKQRYSVVFLANGKRLSFFVSEFSYNGYKEKEVGYLTYKGNKIIDFQWF